MLLRIVLPSSKPPKEKMFVVRDVDVARVRLDTRCSFAQFVDLVAYGSAIVASNGCEIGHFGWELSISGKCTTQESDCPCGHHHDYAV